MSKSRCFSTTGYRRFARVVYAAPFLPLGATIGVPYEHGMFDSCGWKSGESCIALLFLQVDQEQFVALNSRASPVVAVDMGTCTSVASL